MNYAWMDLYGEDGEPDNKPPDKTIGIYCYNCEDLIPFGKMKNWHNDDETVDKLCPGCDTTLIKGE